MTKDGWAAVYEQGAIGAARHYLSYFEAHQGNFEALLLKRNHMLQAISACAQLPQAWPVAIACVRAAHDVMRRSGQWSLWQPYLRLAVEVARRMGDPQLEAEMRTMLAGVHHDMGQWAQAVEEYGRAQAFYETTDDGRRTTDSVAQLARILVGRAQSERMIGNLRQALELAQKALNLSEHLSDTALLGLIYSTLGKLELDEGRPQSALECLKKARTYLIPLGASETLARNYNDTARLYYAQGHWAAAIHYLQLSLQVQEELKDAWMEAQTNANLGILHHALGHWRQAESHLRRAMAIAEEIGAAEALANSHGNLGLVLRDQGRWSEALDHLVEGLNRGMELGHWRLIGNCYANLARLASDERAWDRALYCTAKAREVAERIGDVMLACEADLWASVAYRGKGQLDQAEAACQRVLAELAAKSPDNRQLQADTLESLAAIRLERGQAEAALKLLDQALDLRIGRSDGVGLLSTIVAIAQAEYALGSGNKTAFRVALSCAEELATRYERHDLIARLYMLWGDMALDPASPSTQDLEAAYRAYNYALKLAASGHTERMRMTYSDVRQHLRASLDRLMEREVVNRTAASRFHYRLLRVAQGENTGRVVSGIKLESEGIS